MCGAAKCAPESDPKGDLSEANVPTDASAAGIDRASTLCKHTRGCAHDASYQDDRVRTSVRLLNA